MSKKICLPMYKYITKPYSYVACSLSPFLSLSLTHTLTSAYLYVHTHLQVEIYVYVSFKNTLGFIKITKEADKTYVKLLFFFNDFRK